MWGTETDSTFPWAQAPELSTKMYRSLWCITTFLVSHYPEYIIHDCQSAQVIVNQLQPERHLLKKSCSRHFDLHNAANAAATCSAPPLRLCVLHGQTRLQRRTDAFYSLWSQEKKCVRVPASQGHLDSHSTVQEAAEMNWTVTPCWPRSKKPHLSRGAFL